MATAVGYVASSSHEKLDEEQVINGINAAAQLAIRSKLVYATPQGAVEGAKAFTKNVVHADVVFRITVEKVETTV